MSEFTDEILKQLEDDLYDAEAEYNAARYRLQEGDGSFSRMLEARERLNDYILNKEIHLKGN